MLSYCYHITDYACDNLQNDNNASNATGLDREKRDVIDFAKDTATKYVKDVALYIKNPVRGFVNNPSIASSIVLNFIPEEWSPYLGPNLDEYGGCKGGTALQ